MVLACSPGCSCQIDLPLGHRKAARGRSVGRSLATASSANDLFSVPARLRGTRFFHFSLLQDESRGHEHTPGLLAWAVHRCMTMPAHRRDAAANI